MSGRAVNPSVKRYVVHDEFKTLQPQDPPLEFPSEATNRPTVIVVIGMAGTGKTSAVRALRYHFSRSRLLYNCAEKASRSIHQENQAATSQQVGSELEETDAEAPRDTNVPDVRHMDPVDEGPFDPSSNTVSEFTDSKSRSEHVNARDVLLNTESDYSQLMVGTPVLGGPVCQAVSGDLKHSLPDITIRDQSSAAPTNIRDKDCNVEETNRSPGMEVSDSSGMEVSDCVNASRLDNSNKACSSADVEKIANSDSAARSSASCESVEAKDTATIEPCIVKSKSKCYIINLDPAVSKVPYPANIDIRDTIKYKEVMREYQLGPNGAVITSLNLFATRFDQVLELLEKRAATLDYVIIDTPGQIEVFNWSASGSIILDSLAVTFPTVVVYVIDTPRCRSPITFMSNMMYACSVLYKSRLPFIMAFNKIDVEAPTNCFEWMRQYDAYAEAVQHEDSYMATLSRSCALAMNEFYEGIRSVGISATGHQGLEQLESHIDASRDEYFKDYLPWLVAQRTAVRERRMAFIEEETSKMNKTAGGVSTSPLLRKQVDDDCDDERNTSVEP